MTPEQQQSIEAMIEIKDLPNGSVEEYLKENFNLKPSQKLLDNIDKIFTKWQKVKQSSAAFK